MSARARPAGQAGAGRGKIVAGHDIIVIGASAGGVEALTALVATLPADLPAAVFVVLHLSVSSPSHLPAILARRGPLPVAQAAHGEDIEHGRIYVAPPDQHLRLRDGRVELTRGPRENGVRPAADPLFRSAARAYGPRVVGVVLSGTLGDGALGLSAIAARGGITVAQDPDEALFDGMPRAAIRYARVDHILPADRIGALLGRLAREPLPEAAWQGDDGGRGMDEIDADSPPQIWRDIVAQARDERGGKTTIYTCPECGGTLWQIEDVGVPHFNCHVGHTYSPEALLGHMSEEVEAALWVCVRMLVEKATLTRQFAQRLRADGKAAQADRVEDQAQLDDRHGQVIRDTLLGAGASFVPAFAVEQELRGPGRAAGA